jgi:hypothetical protein
LVISIDIDMEIEKEKEKEINEHAGERPYRYVPIYVH